MGVEGLPHVRRVVLHEAPEVQHLVAGEDLWGLVEGVSLGAPKHSRVELPVHGGLRGGVSLRLEGRVEVLLGYALGQLGARILVGLRVQRVALVDGLAVHSANLAHVPHTCTRAGRDDRVALLGDNAGVVDVSLLDALLYLAQEGLLGVAHHVLRGHASGVLVHAHHLSLGEPPLAPVVHLHRRPERERRYLEHPHRVGRQGEGNLRLVRELDGVEGPVAQHRLDAHPRVLPVLRQRHHVARRVPQLTRPQAARRVSRLHHV
mmetsp:Transcript_18172/g.57132  ORF Transcript_18172/g.57132 Transcript_18172/m.57132 type:complete len:262 (-) Transcript_18172:324-1109(-)